MLLVIHVLLSLRLLHTPSMCKSMSGNTIYIYSSSTMVMSELYSHHVLFLPGSPDLDLCLRTLGRFESELILQTLICVFGPWVGSSRNSCSPSRLPPVVPAPPVVAYTGQLLTPQSRHSLSAFVLSVPLL